MNRQDAKQEIRSNWEPLLQRITTTAQQNVNGRRSYVCPICGHGTHGDGLTFNKRSTGSGALKCFGCGFSGDILDLLQKVNGCDFNRALEMAAGELGIQIDEYDPIQSAQRDFSDADRETRTEQPKGQETGTEAATEPEIADYTEYYRQCAARMQEPAAAAYLQARGISQETAALFSIGYDAKWISPTAVRNLRAKGNTWTPPATARIIMPVTKNHYVARAIDPNEDKYKKVNETGSGSAGIFNSRALYSDNDAVFVVEGIFDALSIIEAGAAAVALNSTVNADLFVSVLDQRRTDAALIICLDNDDAGQRATGKIKNGLDRLGIKYIVSDICGFYKDPNAALTGDREAFIATIQQARHEATADYLQLFFERITTEAYRPYKTELPFFDNLLSGGVVRQSLLLLLAAPGTGKTSLAAQIAERMALYQKPVVYLNLEMSRDQMLAKAISSHVTRAGENMTALDVLQGYRWTNEQRAAVTKAVDQYREKILPYLQYNPDAMSNDLDAIKQYLWSIGDAAKAAGKEAPVVILDYLHLISSSSGLDTQELIKQSVFTLKQYALAFDTFVIGIVATNRISNAAGRITMESGRDSSAIEYSGDYALSLNYYAVDQGTVKPSDVEEMAQLQQSKWRQMIIRVLKGRLCIPGRSARVYFDAAHNIFYGENEFLPVDDERTPFDEEPGQQKRAGRRR